MIYEDFKSVACEEAFICELQGVLCRTLEGHGHWVNQLALNTDYVMRTGPYEPAEATLVHKEHHWDG